MRFSGSIPTSPRQAYENMQTVHLMYLAAIGCYFRVGETLRFGVANFESRGFADLGSSIWIVRGVLSVLAVVELFLGLAVFNDRMVAKVISRSKGVTDRTVWRALDGVRLGRPSFCGAISIFGLVLYLLNANRIDLYGFGAVSLLALLLVRPKRELWETTFRDMSIQYPGVSSSPWAPQS
jgi:hypothetical protein